MLVHPWNFLLQYFMRSYVEYPYLLILTFLTYFHLMKFNFAVYSFPAPPENPTGGIVDLGTPFYQDGQLQVHVYWQSVKGMWAAACTCVPSSDRTEQFPATELHFVKAVKSFHFYDSGSHDAIFSFFIIIVCLFFFNFEPNET